MKKNNFNNRKDYSKKNYVNKYLRIYFIFLFSFSLKNIIIAQQQPLYILTDKFYNKEVVSSDSVNAGIKRRVGNLLDELHLSNLFTPVVIDKKDLQPSDYFIKMYSSYNYLTSNQKESLIPQFIVHKKNWQTPYYYSYFIARKQPSRFNSFNDFASVKRIYLQNNSMSGYYSALYKFWEMGFIKNPSVKSLKDELQKEVFVYNSPDSVINAVSKDDYSIGATGEENFGNLNVEIKLVNMVLPQDIICISQSLTPYEEKLKTLINRLFSDTILINNLHLYISHVVPFSQTYVNSYHLNENIIKTVNATKEVYDKDIYLSRAIPLNDKIEFKDILAFIGKSSLSVYLWIFGILLSIFTFGYNTGHIFLPFVEKIKKAFQTGFKYKGSDS